MNLAMLDTHELEDILLAPPATIGSGIHCSENAVVDYPPKGEVERATRVRHALAAAHELLARAAHRYIKGRSLYDSPGAAKEFLKVHFAGLEHEVFVVIYLDCQNRVIDSEELFRGTISQTSVYPREVLKRALHFNAAGILFAHNHPSSGDVTESRADMLLTSTLTRALAMVDVRVVDHIIVSGNNTRSFAEHGLL